MSKGTTIMQAQTALAGFTVSASAATVAWIDHVEQILRMGSSLVAICTGIAALVFYGKQNGWWGK
jgi:hypothetical protein